jgi:hypothetical protein
MSVLEVPGARLYYEVRGAGPLLPRNLFTVATPLRNDRSQERAGPERVGWPAHRAHRAPRPGLTRQRAKRRRRRELPTTLTLENAIAAPAIMGLSSPKAASGTAATL